MVLKWNHTLEVSSFSDDLTIALGGGWVEDVVNNRIVDSIKHDLHVKEIFVWDPGIIANQ